MSALADVPGISDVRCARGETPVIYPVDEIFSVGGSAVLRQSDTDRVTVVAGGVSVHEALRAADLLADDGIEIRVVDAYSIKPIDKEGLRIAASATGGRVVTVEDHRAEGGLGDAVLDAFANDPTRRRS